MGNRDLASARARLERLPYDPELGCLSVVAGAAVEDVLVALGGDPAEPVVPVVPVQDVPIGLPSAVVFAAAGGAVALEFGGREGSRPEVMRRLAQRGRAGSVAWIEETELTLAEDRKILFQARMRQWPDTEVEPPLAPYFAQLDFARTRGMAADLLVVERFTGVR
jgi:hypothetical protein